MKRICAFLLLPILLAVWGHAPLVALGAGGEDTAAFALALSAENAPYAWRLTDGWADSYVSFSEGETLGILPAAGTKGVYIKWRRPPKGVILRETDSSDRLLYYDAPEEGCLNSFFPVASKCARIQLTGADFAVSEILACTADRAPAGLGLLQPPPAQAEVLLLAAHTGDEILRFGDLLTACADRGVGVKTLFLSDGGRDEQQSALGVQELLTLGAEPVFAGYEYLRTQMSMADTRPYYPAREMIDYLAELIYTTRPQAVVTHQADGEDGDGFHALTAELVTEAVDQARLRLAQEGLNGDFAFWRHDAAGSLWLDGEAPLHNLGGKTAHALAMEGFDLYKAFRTFRLEAPRFMPYALISGASGGILEQLAQGGMTSPPAAASPDGKAAPAGAALLAMDGTPADQPDQEKWQSFFDLPEGQKEAVVFDDKQGRYAYTSELLSIQIQRYETDQPLVYFVAHIRMRGADAFRPGYASLRKNGTNVAAAWKIARENKAVLAVTGDNMVQSEPEKKGFVIRDGKLYCENNRESSMLLTGNMEMRVIHAWQARTQELIQDGIRNAYSFGPILVEDGVPCQDVYKHRVYRNNPRVGVGMVEPGHFVVIVADGRVRKYSTGLDLDAYAQLFVKEGCSVAYNLDGGASAAMVFMGEHLNKRSIHHWTKLPDMMLWGYSDLVPDVDAPLTMNGILYED